MSSEGPYNNSDDHSCVDSTDSNGSSSFSYRNWKSPRIGMNHQALIQPYSTPQITVDHDLRRSGTLIWDPSALDYKNLDQILEICKINRNMHHSSMATMNDDEYTHSTSVIIHEEDTILNDTPEYHFEHYIDTLPIIEERSKNKEPLSPLKMTNNDDHVIGLEDILQIIHDCHYNKDRVLDRLKDLKLLGWHPKRPNYRQWCRHEIELFELAMIKNYKQFKLIQSIVKTKNIADCVEFYFAWKHTPRFFEWLENKSLLRSDRTRPLEDGGAGIHSKYSTHNDSSPSSIINRSKRPRGSNFHIYDDDSSEFNHSPLHIPSTWNNQFLDFNHYPSFDFLIQPTTHSHLSSHEQIIDSIPSADSFSDPELDSSIMEPFHINPFSNRNTTTPSSTESFIPIHTHHSLLDSSPSTIDPIHMFISTSSDANHFHNTTTNDISSRGNTTPLLFKKKTHSS